MKILCAEGLWDEEISTRRVSYKSIIDLVSTETGCDTSYFSFTTGKELENLFSIFKKSKYDIFYLASHMEDGLVVSGFDDEKINIYQSVDKTKGCLKNKVLHLAGCSSMANEYVGPMWKDFGLKALSGYAIDTDTTESSAMDILYLVNMLKFGTKNLYKKLNNDYPDLVKASGFFMYDGKEN